MGRQEMGPGHLKQEAETETPAICTNLQRAVENFTQQFRRQERKIIFSLVEGGKKTKLYIPIFYFKWIWSPDLPQPLPRISLPWNQYKYWSPSKIVAIILRLVYVFYIHAFILFCTQNTCHIALSILNIYIKTIIQVYVCTLPLSRFTYLIHYYLPTRLNPLQYFLTCKYHSLSYK